MAVVSRCGGPTASRRLAVRERRRRASSTPDGLAASHAGTLERRFALGLGEQARDRGRGARRGRGGDRLARRAGRAARLDASATCSPTPRACPSTGTAPIARARDGGASTRTAASSCSPPRSRRAAGMPFARLLRGGLGLPARRLGGPRRRGAARGRSSRSRASSLAPSGSQRATLAEAASVQFAGLDGVLPGFGRFEPNDWGLGLELRDAKQPHWTGRAQLAGDLRPLRPQRRLPLGRPARPGSRSPASPTATSATGPRTPGRRLADAVLARPPRARSRPRLSAARALAGGAPSCSSLASPSPSARSSAPFGSAPTAEACGSPSSNEHHRRDRRDAVALREPLLLVDVDLDELDVVLVGDPVEHGRDGVARAAPLGPEVDDHLAL